MSGKNAKVPEEVKIDPAQTVPPTPILMGREEYQDLTNETTERYLKNIAYGTPLELARQVDYAQGQVVSKTLVQNSYVGVTLFAMAAGEGISAHKSTGDALVTVLEGKGKITIDAKDFELKKGQSIVMPAGHPHAVSAVEHLKMLLVVIFPSTN